MSNETHEIFVTGLRNAHAMEKQALAMLQPQANRIRNYPEVSGRIEQHIAETEGQIQRLGQLLGDRNEEHSSFKDMVMSVVGGMGAMGHAVADDEILKNSLANYAFENYEIAAYNSLIALAKALNLQEAVPVLKQNLAEEEAMALWLDEHLSDVTLQYAGLREAGLTAKR